jgi:two-component system chemotaxis response regulator CheY
MTGQKIHLIVSDVNMPNMNGITFVKEVKKLDKYKFTPICMLSTEGGRAEMNEGKAAGAKAWMVKPFQPPKLLEVIAKLVP